MGWNTSFPTRLDWRWASFHFVVQVGNRKGLSWCVSVGSRCVTALGSDMMDSLVKTSEICTSPEIDTVKSAFWPSPVLGWPIVNTDYASVRLVLRDLPKAQYACRSCNNAIMRANLALTYGTRICPALPRLWDYHPVRLLFSCGGYDNLINMVFGHERVSKNPLFSSRYPLSQLVISLYLKEASDITVSLNSIMSSGILVFNNLLLNMHTMTDLYFIRTSSRNYVRRLLCRPPWQSRRRQRTLYKRSSHSPRTSQLDPPIRSLAWTGAEPSWRGGIVPQPTTYDRSSPST